MTCADVLKDRFDTRGWDGVGRWWVELTWSHGWSYLDDVFAEAFGKLLWIAAVRNGCNAEVSCTVFDERIGCELDHDVHVLLLSVLFQNGIELIYWGSTCHW
jgi:hypothetical protein